MSQELIDSPPLWMSYTIKNSLKIILGHVFLRYMDGLRILVCNYSAMKYLSRRISLVNQSYQWPTKLLSLFTLHVRTDWRRFPFCFNYFLLNYSFLALFFKLKIVSLTHFLERLKQDLHPTICSHSCLRNQYMQTSILPSSLLCYSSLHYIIVLVKAALLFLPKLVPCCLPQLGKGTKIWQTSN